MNKKTRILVIDSDAGSRLQMRRLVDQLGHDWLEAGSGDQGLAVVRDEQPDLIILDIETPGLNGLDVLGELKSDSRTQSIPVVITSANQRSEMAVAALETGADDFLNKPVNAQLFAARIRNSLSKKQLRDLAEEHARQADAYNAELVQRVRRQIREISAGHIATIFAMSKLAESRDPETGEHLERMREYCRVLARVLRGYSKYRSVIDDEYIETIYAASPLHDIGKVGVPDMVLLKPDKLDPAEWELMKTHSTIGSYTLREVHSIYPENRFVLMGIEIAHSHHEKWDGTGYPQGLRGEATPLCARILALADVYDALRSPRVYKPPFTHEKSHGIIMESNGTQFDPDVVQAYLDVEAEFAAIRDTFEDPDQPGK